METRTGTEIAMGLAPTIGEVIEEKERMAARKMRERCAKEADRLFANMLGGYGNQPYTFEYFKNVGDAIRDLPLVDTGTEPRPSSVE